MSSLLKAELLTYRRLACTDIQDASHSLQQRITSFYGMKLMLIQLWIKGCTSVRHNRRLQIYIVRRLIAKRPTALYQHALTLVSTGECAAAMVLLDIAITKSHLLSYAPMAHLLMGGREGVVMDYNRAIELAKEGERLGCYNCQGVMARCFRSVCWESVKEAKKSASNSSKFGSEYGQLALGLLYYLEKNKGVARNYAKALMFFRLSAEQGLAEAQYYLGEMYRNSDGVTRDAAEALRLYKLAATQGHAWASYQIARLYDCDRDIPKNKDEAIRWYRRAQKAGISLGDYMLRKLDL
jgi:hypothetical protein